MRTSLITYCTPEMSISAGVCVESALRNNVDTARILTSDNIDESFKAKNRAILSQPRGGGYWLWKPYIIYTAMNQDCKEGDILIYSDAGVEIVNNINWITDRMKGQDVFLFGNMYQHEHWCKADVIKAICPTTKTGKQVQASVMFIRVSEWSKMFVKRWLDYCTRPGFIDDSKSVSKNHVEFQEHRHDQAVLTCLAYKNGIPLHWWPAIYNGGIFTYDHSGYGDVYPPIFHHHRLRNEDYKKIDNISLHIKNYMRRKGYKSLLV
jgi:hypothetical protein